MVRGPSIWHLSKTPKARKLILRGFRSDSGVSTDWTRANDEVTERSGDQAVPEFLTLATGIAAGIGGDTVLS